MIKEHIQAFAGAGDDKRMIGEEEIELPENLKEAVSMFSQDSVLAGFIRQLKTDIKNRLRAAPTGGKRAEELYQKCLAADLSDAKAREISGFTGQAGE